MDHLYNFVIYVNDKELEYYRETTIENNLHLFSRWGFDWCLQPYLRLKKNTNLRVNLSNRLLPDCINVIHSAQLNMEIGKPKHFIVCARADFPRRNWAHFHLVQNRSQIEKNTSFIPHWVQPGLIGRRKERKLLKRVGYAGQVFNGNLAAGEEEWKKRFKEHGIDFVVLPPESCFDLSEIDVLIGIRSFSKFRYNTKPASKLVNAWHAGIPFIGGFDSAFEQLGNPGKDYLRVSSMQEVIDSVVRLKNYPDYYQSFVFHGNEKAKKYNDNATLERWESVFGKDVTLRYHQWQSRQQYEKSRFIFLTGVSKVESIGKDIVKNTLCSNAVQTVKQKLLGR